jgi:hypothetical protein
MHDTMNEIERIEAERDPKASPTAVVGIVGILLLVASVIGTQALYYGTERFEVEQKVYNPPVIEIADIRAEQFARIHRVAWIDKEKEVVAIPIERAMELAVRELKSGESPAKIDAPDSDRNPPAGNVR